MEQVADRTGATNQSGVGDRDAEMTGGIVRELLSHYDHDPAHIS